MIAYDVECQLHHEAVIRRAHAHIEVTRNYIDDVRGFLRQVRETRARSERAVRGSARPTKAGSNSRASLPRSWCGLEPVSPASPKL
jgi:hypothetical protein